MGKAGSDHGEVRREDTVVVHEQDMAKALGSVAADEYGDYLRSYGTPDMVYSTDPTDLFGSIQRARGVPICHYKDMGRWEDFQCRVKSMSDKCARSVSRNYKGTGRGAA